MAVKLSKADMVKPFSGSGGEGVDEWIAKVELVAAMTGVKDEAKFLPLLLEGGAMAVYMERITTTRSVRLRLKRH